MSDVDEEFLKFLEKKLAATTQWPSVYMFKFIVPAANKRLALVESLFSSEANITS